MKLILVMLTLFSFSGNEKYKVEINSCKDNEIIFSYNDKEYTSDLFNIDMKKDGWDYACDKLVNAKNVEIEVENILLEEKIEAYFFVDNELLNTLLIEEDKADIRISNPNYKYFKDIVNSKEVMAPISKEDTKGLPSGYYALGFLIICVVLELFLSRRLKVHS